MKLEIEKAFGIKSKMTFDGGDNKNLIIFGPNGAGKTSIAKTLKSLKNGIIEGFGLEQDGSKDSLIIENKNMKSLYKDIQESNDPDNWLLIVDNKNLGEEVSKNPIKNYIAKKDDKSSLQAFYNSYDSIVYEIWEEHKSDFNYEPKNEKISELFQNELKDENINDFLSTVKKLREKGNPEKIMESKAKLKELYNDYEQMVKIEQILKSRKNVSLANIFEAIEAGSNGYDNNLKAAFPIMSDIKNKELDEAFGYKINNDFKEIKEIYENIEKEVAKKGLPKTELNVFLKNIDLFTKHKIKTTNKTTSNKAKKLLNEIQKAEEDHASHILKNQTTFDAMEYDLKKNISNYKSQYNQIVRSINNFINSSDDLMWKIQVEEIKTPFDEFKMTVYYNNEESEIEDMQEYASTGQLRIIELALALFQWENSKLLVIDDVLSSLDFDNSSIIIEMISKIQIPIIFLTHNFAITNKIAYNEKLKACSSFHVIDSTIINHPYTFKIQSTFNLTTISSVLSSENLSPILDIAKKSMVTGILYEYIDNYIQNTFHYNNMDQEGKTETQDALNEIKSNINKYSRHWKNYETKVSELSNELTKNPNIKNAFFGEISVFKILTNDKTEKEYSTYFLDQDTSEKIMGINENINLIDWLSMKYYIAMRIRQLIEKFIIQKHPVLNEGWGDNEIFGLGKFPSENYIKVHHDSNKTLLDEVQQIFSLEDVKLLLKINGKINFINHLDNLKWTPIFEFPTHKLIQYLDIVNETISKK